MEEDLRGIDLRSSCRSTALCVARLSAMFALLLGLSTFDLLGGVGGCGCGSSRLSEALLFLCGLRLLLSGLFVLRWGAEGGVGVVVGGGEPWPSVDMTLVRVRDYLAEALCRCRY